MSGEWPSTHCPATQDNEHAFLYTDMEGRPRCQCGMVSGGRPSPTEPRTTTGVDHPETSHQAALRIEPLTGTQRGRILNYLRNVGINGATDQELQQMLRISESAERPRRGELVRQEWVVDSGKTRQTSSGAQAIVWVYSPE